MTLVRALAATALVAGATVLVAPAPAGAATCAGGGGVSVVVDYRELGGATITACAADGAGKSAAAIFDEVGVRISYASRQPGFVCRVNDAPASDPCVNTSPADAFWGLWWSDGTKPWTYSSSGVGSLTVPAGGSVGWSWQQDRQAGDTVPPGVPAPTAQATSPSPAATSTTSSPTPTGTSSSSPTKTPSPQPTSSPTSRSSGGDTGSAARSGRGTGSGPGATATEEPGSAQEVDPSPGPTSATSARADESVPKGARGRGEGKARASADPTARPTTPSTDPGSMPDSDADGAGADEATRIPAAVTWGVVALLGVAALASAVVSRRRRGA